MIADLKPYSKYKKSELQWLGDVPAHWDLRPTFGAFAPNSERNDGLKEKTVLSLSYGRIVIKPAEKLHGLVPESFETYQIVNPGDIVLRTTDLQNDHTSLRVGFVNNRGIITSAYLALRAIRGVDPKFGFQFLNVWDTSKAIYGYGSGLRHGLDFSHFKRMSVAIPPADEQDAIVRFLDWANGRLDRAIRAKRKVIALLNEQKQAIIHRAVTRGLDPSVPLKPSGIPWLGEVPNNWEVTVAKRVCSVFIPQRDKPELNEVEGFPWVTLENIGKTFVKTSRFYVRDRDAQAVGIRTAPSDSVLASCVGRFGIASITTEPVVINQQIQAFIPRRGLSKFFLRYSVLVAKPYFEMHGNSTTLAYVDREGFETMPLLVPPLSEQEGIVQHLEKATANIDSAISRLEREVELLREYRARIVADVVTGKLDVREAAAKLPVEEQAIEPEEIVEDESEMIEVEIT